MKGQFKDKFYDDFFKEPTRESFRQLLQNNYGELDNFEFKKEWINKGKLSKTILAMGNSEGSIRDWSLPEFVCLNPMSEKEIKENINIKVPELSHKVWTLWER